MLMWIQYEIAEFSPLALPDSTDWGSESLHCAQGMWAAEVSMVATGLEALPLNICLLLQLEWTYHHHMWAAKEPM